MAMLIAVAQAGMFQSGGTAGVSANLAGAVSQPGSIDELRAHFAAPPPSARPETWWHWINGNITKEGITADLEAMKQAGIGGAYIFDVGLFDAYYDGTSVTIPAGPINYNSPEWRDLVVHATKEADRLGLNLGLHNCCGWSSSGGPWVKPDDATKIVVSTEEKVEGPSKFNGKLPRGTIYRDIAVLAFPTPAEESGTAGADADTAKQRQRLDQWLYGLGEKGGDYGFGPMKAPTVRKADLVDLTSRMMDDGTLDWDVPPGHWTILRLGYQLTGAQNRAATDSGRGLEVDKLSSECFDRFFDGGLAPLIREAGPLAGRSLTTAVIDSYEIWYQNWTDRMRDEFRRLRGYDLMPYLPALTGLVVDDPETTERFLFDFRRTIADLFAENYSGRMADRLHEHGMALAIEPYGMGNYNCFTYGQPASLVMGEFWFRERQPHWCVKMASSTAHVYGRTVVGAESLTSMPADDGWRAHPYLYKPYADRAFALGINRLIFHTFAHQPWVSGVLPGMTMGPFGAFMNRMQTWWGLAPAWFTYLSRCQYLLQSGRFVADVCLFVGEQNPIPSRYAFDSLLPQVPDGYDFDFCGLDGLMEMKVQDGRLVLPSEMSYRMLVLPDTDRMTPPLARKIQSLVKGGATVVGPKPAKSPCLMDMGKGDEEVARIAEEVWGNCDGKSVAEHKFGKGRAIWGKPLDRVLAEAKVTPDFRCDSATVNWIHRRLSDGDVYFVSSFQTVPTDYTCTFRVQGRRPEIWHPDTGAIEEAPMWRAVPGGVEVPLRLDPAGSVFVVFRKPAGKADPVVEVVPEGVMTLSKAPKPVKIVKAEYGILDDKAKTREVTRAVAASMQGYRVEVWATNEALGGDPAPGEVKSLRLIYEDRGKQVTVTLKEGEALTVGPDVPVASVSPVPLWEVSVSRSGTVQLLAWQPGRYRVRTVSGREAVVDADDVPAALTIAGPWEVHFPAGWDAPERTTFDKLISWTEHPEFGIKYFSGTATYIKRFQVPKGLVASARRLVLDLGVVHELAQVRLNGREIGVLWKPPFRLDVTDAVKAGENLLEVKVTNTWGNRLIGDEQFPDDLGWLGGTLKAWPEWLVKGELRPEPRRKTFTTWQHNTKDTPLMDSGLLGPVTLRPVQVLPVEFQDEE